ncbi:hypothetical protein K3495_g15228 [Podosphaera aphanis]|nr:hypothetical protein K3495_g15228 [Podosphaera aphanis]
MSVPSYSSKSPAPRPESLEDRPPIDSTVNVGEMKSLEDDKDVDPLFSGVLARVQLDKVPRFCLDLRRKLEMQHDNSHAEISIDPADIEKPIFGGFHALFPIRFADGVKWLLKIPLIGVETQFDESASAALTSEALTMRFLRANTSIPIPNVYAFDASLDSELGCPFILLEFISGIPLQECWFDESRSISQDVMQARRSRILKDIASAMAQLDRFAFDSGGALIFDDDGSPIGAAATKYFDDVADLQQINYDIDNNIDIPRYPKFYKAGPWTTVESFYLHALDRETNSTASYAKGICQLLRILYQLIPEPIDTRPKFVLAHPDFHVL